MEGGAGKRCSECDSYPNLSEGADGAGGLRCAEIRCVPTHRISAHLSPPAPSAVQVVTGMCLLLAVQVDLDVFVVGFPGCDLDVFVVGCPDCDLDVFVVGCPDCDLDVFGVGQTVTWM